MRCEAPEWIFFFLEISKISKNTSILVGDNVAKWDYVKWGDRTPVRGGGDVISGGILKALLGHCWTTLKHFSIFLESQTPRQKWNSLFWLNISSLLSLLEILGVCEWFSPDLRIPKMRSTKKEQWWQGWNYIGRDFVTKFLAGAVPGSTLELLLYMNCTKCTFRLIQFLDASAFLVVTLSERALV